MTMEAGTHTHHDHEGHHGHEGHHHHEMPTEGGALTAVAISATLHCLTGCAIGEVLGMVIGTAAGFSEWGTVGLAVGLAFLFGYLLTSIPLLRAGLAVAAVVPIALASDTLSIATMEIVDNAIMLAVPGAMEAGVGDVLFWGALAFALVIAGVFAVPVNRWLIARGRGHAVVHETGIHGGPSPRTVGIVAAVAFVFGSTVLIAEALSSDGEGHGGGHEAAAPARGHEAAGPAHGPAGPTGLRLAATTREFPRGEAAPFEFTVRERSGAPVRDFELEHARRLHLIVVRRDLTGFQHLHPRMRANGTWATPLTLPEPGRYRAYADFKRDGRKQVLPVDLTVAGSAPSRPLPPPASTASTEDGYRVQVAGSGVRAGQESELRFAVTRGGAPVAVEPYLGADGHLVALREGDLAYLHTHPEGGTAAKGGHGGEAEHAAGAEHAPAVRNAGGAITFATTFPTAANYRLFLQFKHEGKVHTAAFTQRVSG
jgi:hypothetical protein